MYTIQSDGSNYIATEIIEMLKKDFPDGYIISLPSKIGMVLGQQWQTNYEFDRNSYWSKPEDTSILNMYRCQEIEFYDIINKHTFNFELKKMLK